MAYCPPHLRRRSPAAIDLGGRGVAVTQPLALDSAGKEHAFRRLRAILPAGQGTVRIDGRSVVVSCLPADVAPAIRATLAVLSLELAPIPPRRLSPAAA